MEEDVVLQNLLVSVWKWISPNHCFPNLKSEEGYAGSNMMVFTWCAFSAAFTVTEKKIVSQLLVMPIQSKCY